MADGADPYAVSRRHHLAALSYEAGLRGLETRLIGPGGDILRIADPSDAAEQIAAFLGR